jgi:hypothetical protein
LIGFKLIFVILNVSDGIVVILGVSIYFGHFGGFWVFWSFQGFQGYFGAFWLF